MAGNGKPDGASDQQSLGDLVALAAKDVSSLIRYEIALAKTRAEDRRDSAWERRRDLSWSAC